MSEASVLMRDALDRFYRRMRRPRPIDFCGFPTLTERRVSF
jgi:hypothetical protein